MRKYGEVKIKILKVKSNLAYGKIIEIIKPSEARVESDCETYQKCGGCDLRHVSYGESLKIKENSVKNTINKFFNSTVKINSIIGMENPFYYRNKIELKIVNNKIGFYKKNSNDLINIDNWIKELNEKKNDEQIFMILIGNKCDLEEKRKVSYQEGKDFATSNGMQFIETSAKADTKVKDAFELLTQEIIKSTITKDKGMEKKEKTVHLSSGTADLNTKKKSCC